MITRFEHMKSEFLTGYANFASFKTFSREVDKNERVYASFGQTFAFSANAHLEVACMHLARILDRSSGTENSKPLSFKSIILAIKENATAFTRASDKEIRKAVEADLRWCSPVSNTDMQWLIDFRNNALAHHGAIRLDSEEDKKLSLAIHYSEFDLEVMDRLFDQLGDRINKYQLFGIEYPFTWKDWYIPEAQMRLIAILEASLKAEEVGSK